MTDPILTTGDLLTVALLFVVGGSFVASLLVLIADWPWRAPRHDVADDLTTLLPSRTVARPVGERTGGVRVAGPHAATERLVVPVTAPTARPYVDGPSSPAHDTVPVLVVDSPPGARGKLPTGPLGVPIVRERSSLGCSLCHDDSTKVFADECLFCGRPAAVRV